MATIERYETPAAQRVTRSATANRTAADQNAGRTKRRRAVGQQRRSPKMAGEYVAPSLGRTTVGELASEWLARKTQSTAPSPPPDARVGVAGPRRDRGGDGQRGRGRPARRRGVDRQHGSHGSGATTVLRAYGVLVGHPGRRGEGQATGRQPR